jgi:hypothetical protein
LAKEQGLTVSGKKLGIFGAIKEGAKTALKSYLFSDILSTGGPHDTFTTQTFWQRIVGHHSFNRQGLEYLVETGYCNNPVGFGIIQKIFLSSKNLKFTPYRDGKAIDKKFVLDMGAGIGNLCQTGNVFIWNKEVVGFGKTPVILNTLKMQEVCKGNNRYEYWYQLDNVTRVLIPEEDLVHRKFIDPVGDSKFSRMGLSPLQAALMPIESLKEMYVADTSMLKNKGVDVMITNDSDEAMIEEEKGEMDRLLNERVGNARRQGGVATSTNKLRVLQLGRSVKELALWDGYKVKERDLCNALQVDSGLFNDPDNKTYSNRAEANKALYTECVIPYCQFILDDPKLMKWLGYEVYIDTSEIECLQISQNLRFEKNKTIQEAIISLNQSVKDNVINRDIAVGILVTEWKFDKEEATLMIVDRATNTNETTDKVNTLSPIVATKVLESMTTNERRDLVGLSDMADGNTIPTPAPAF